MGGAALGSAFRAGASATPPNVLMILVDQMRTPRWFPQSAVLPGFDRLCSEGAGFTNHFACAVPCSPSRASILTGLHITQHGVQMNVDPIGDVPSLDPGIPTLGHIFKNAGYQTPYFGKWHLTNMRDYWRVGLEPYGFQNWRGPDHDGLPYEGLEYDGLFAHQARRWLEKNGGQGPWFLTCSLINPHDICFYKHLDVPPALVPNVCDRLPANLDDSLESKPRVQKAYQQGYGKLMGTTPDQPERAWRQYLDFYYYLNRKVDDQITEILDTLDRLGLAENTMVIFTSDHGEMCGSHKLQAKGPFVYQENNNVPLVVRWPGRVQAGFEIPALAHNVDIVPTLAELAGVKAPGQLPGKSLAPILNQTAAGVHDHILMAFGYNLDSPVMSGLANAAGPGGQIPPRKIRAIFDGRYKFARYFDKGCRDEFELYDLENDPIEMENLAHDPGRRAVQKEMADRLQEAEAAEMAPL